MLLPEIPTRKRDGTLTFMLSRQVSALALAMVSLTKMMGGMRWKKRRIHGGEMERRGMGDTQAHALIP
jgi:hypothetical protein